MNSRTPRSQHCPQPQQCRCHSLIYQLWSPGNWTDPVKIHCFYCSMTSSCRITLHGMLHDIDETLHCTELDLLCCEEIVQKHWNICQLNQIVFLPQFPIFQCLINCVWLENWNVFHFNEYRIDIRTLNHIYFALDVKRQDDNPEGENIQEGLKINWLKAPERWNFLWWKFPLFHFSKRPVPGMIFILQKSVRWNLPLRIFHQEFPSFLQILLPSIYIGRNKYFLLLFEWRCI